MRKAIGARPAVCSPEKGRFGVLYEASTAIAGVRVGLGGSRGGTRLPVRNITCDQVQTYYPVVLDLNLLKARGDESPFSLGRKFVEIPESRNQRENSFATTAVMSGLRLSSPPVNECLVAMFRQLSFGPMLFENAKCSRLRSQITCDERH